MKSNPGTVAAPRAVRRPDSQGVRIAKVVFWWVCLPALMIFIGYRFVGPSIGRVPEIKKGAQKILANSVQDPETPDGGDTVSDASKPTIDISVEKGAARPKPQTEPRSRRKKPKPKPSASDADRVESPKQDPASGDGATPPPDGDPASGAGDGTGRGEGVLVRLPVV
ncbi:MAG: hypothetical protein JST30_04635 [Armatimonadetes bacterium]|nr:hypothetical protein [Armatimonadota bacterium]